MDRKVAIASLVLLAPIVMSSGVEAGQLVLKVRPGQDNQAAERAAAANHGRVKKVLPQLGAKVIDLPDNANVDAIVSHLRKHPHFEYVEKDHVAQVRATPNDSYYSRQWHHNKIGTESAWDSSRGDGMTIAIIDTGVNAVADLSGRLVPGYNTHANNSDTRDTQGHGTAVAGVAAAAGNNGSGVAGMAWNSKIMPMRITPDGEGWAYYSDMAEAMVWAADHGADVMNLSFGVTQYSDTINRASKYAWDKGIIITHSAGNENTGISTSNFPYLLTVAATDQYDRRASFSNWGQFVDFAAPGVSIYTTRMDGSYSGWSGTSFSAPMTAGLIALMKSKAPSLSAAHLVDTLKASATDLGSSGYDTTFGYGRINAQAALARLGNTTAPAPTTEPTPTTEPAPSEPEPTVSPSPGSDTTRPSVKITSPSRTIVRGTVSVSASTSDNIGVTKCEILVNNRVRQSITGTKLNGCGFNWDTNPYGRGYHTLTARAFDASGNQSSYSKRFYKY